MLLKACPPDHVAIGRAGPETVSGEVPMGTEVSEVRERRKTSLQASLSPTQLLCSGMSPSCLSLYGKG